MFRFGFVEPSAAVKRCGFFRSLLTDPFEKPATPLARAHRSG
jgi:hypothetical protein